MYLKQLELVGFKSFADRTKLEFGPGMTAIVGPNGCGKSNVSDAVRWVLGEQSAKAMRGSSMQDVIFNGTDAQKPMGMAEVSLTLTDCEDVLGTDFNEITVTRRVLRSGEGQYFINKAPCRLKDIQRLFMDTGIGTNAYSVLEQGRIDRILSSRPEDRRAVFEEASGITKYKADKKEALRKLDHTEANLLRLEDIVREVKRQIISLQRQAGKARRYKSMHARLRSLDIFVTRSRITDIDSTIKTIEGKLTSFTEQDEAFHEDIEKTEALLTATRNELHQIENEINEIMDRSVQAKTELDRTRQMLTTNRERIQEMRDLSERNTSEAEAARERLTMHQQNLEELSGKLEEAIQEHTDTEKLYQERQKAFSEFDTDLNNKKEQVHLLQNESVDTETNASRLQNELADIEARERGTVLKRERLMAEHSEVKRAIELYNQRVQRKEQQRSELMQEVERKQEQLNQLKQLKHNREAQLAELKEKLNSLQSLKATKQGQIDLLTRSENDNAPFPGGARFLMNPPADLEIDTDSLLGPLADQIEAEPEYRKPLEAVMRIWLDALIIRNDEACRQVLSMLETEGVGAVRLVNADMPEPPAMADGPGDPLIDHVICEPDAQALMKHLLYNVRVVDSLNDIPASDSSLTVWVTRTGSIIRQDGSAEFWMAESETSNPLTRKHLISEWTAEVEELEKSYQKLKADITRLQEDESSSETAVNEAQEQLSSCRRDLAVCEGETQQIQREAKQAGERQETISWELKELEEQNSTGGNRRTEIVNEIERLRNRQAEIRSSIQNLNNELRKLEADRTRLHAELTDSRVALAEKKHRVDHYRNQEEPLKAQIQSLEQIIEERSRGISSYQQHIETLQQRITEAEQQIAPLEQDVMRYDEMLLQTRNRQRDTNTKQSTLEEELRHKRLAQEEIRSQKGKLDVQVTEHRMRRTNILDRINADYQLREEQLGDEPEPEWEEEDENREREYLETTIAELRTKINSMGPVNLVAIEEHQELEERFQFLSQQQEDLLNAKQQLLDMIKHINNTTTELFSETFNKVNDNFQVMFKKLFGGGSAKLVLVNEEEVLESGIEIIARPPGKKLQNISLLSGGERTMTAVGLLFSLYLVKPSPFCVLDELDAALDDSNIGRFVKTVQEFLESSQFIVITHSRQTISAADVLYGVTMEKHGISKIVAVKLSDHANDDNKSNAKSKKSFAGKG